MAGFGAMTILIDDLVPDDLWALVAPLLPVPPRPPYGGRLLPARELGCGSPATSWRRFTEWAEAGIFDALHLKVLDRLGEQGQLDWSRASVDAMSVRAKRGGTTWAQIRSIVASLGPSSIWSATAVGCR